MEPPEGFSLLKGLRSNERSEMHLAREAATGRQVVLKSYRGPEAGEVARRERERLRKLVGPGMLVPTGLELDGPEPILVFEGVGGLDLDLLLQRASSPPPIADWIDIAAHLAATIRHLHAKHWLHRDLRPSNVLVAHGTNETRLLDLECAVEFGSTAAQRMDGDPAYMAPEQFGRMGRGVDFRSDLYALGATLYHVLTGRPPFAGSDPLELMHAHMAQRPVAPREIRAEIPEPLSRLLLMLLEKEPDGRYQTAHALHQDLLECQRLWAERETLPDDLALGASDAASRPLFTKRLYGRDPEIAALAGALERVRAGGSEMWLIRGAPGAGKSVLIEELRSRSLKRGWLAQGKFDLYRRDQPYSGFSAALEALAQQILVRGEDEIRGWRKRVERHLGNNVCVLVEWIPDWRFILGERPQAPRLEPRETQVRLGRTTVRLLEAAARPEEPLILFLDDLQWTDPGSRFLLCEIAREPGLAGLLLVATYRDGEVDSVHPLRAVLEEMERSPLPVHALDIGPLAREATLHMLADAFEKPHEEVGELADVVLTKTENNPFLIQQFVNHMRSLGHIGFSASDGWYWDVQAIASAEISDDAVELIAARIEQLAPHAREVLVFASFIGDEFDAGLLCELANRDLAAVEFALCALSEHGLIVPCRAGFRFVHDRIREAAQSLKSEAERTQLHYSTASLLLDRTPEATLAAAAADIVEHFNRALGRVPPEKIPKVVQLNVWAARQAFEAGAPGAARVYADAAHELTQRGLAQLDAALHFELDFLRAETRELAGEYEEAEQIAASLAERDLGPIELARAAALRMDICIFMQRERGRWDPADLEKATEIGVQALRRLRVPYPDDPSHLAAGIEALRTCWAIRNLTADDFLRDSKEPDERQRAILRLEANFGLIYHTRGDRAFLAAARRTRLFRQGYSGGYLPNTLAGLGSAMIGAFGWYETGERMAKICMELLERGYPTITRGAAAMGAHHIVFAWKRHPSVIARDLEAVTRATLEEGDLLMASTGGSLVARWRLIAGEPLPDVVRSYRVAEDFARRSHDRGMVRALEGGRAILECLCSPEPLEPEAIPFCTPQDSSVEMVRGFFWLVLGDYPRAFTALERIPQVAGTPEHAFFHRALACALLLQTPQCPDERRVRKILKRDIQWLRKAARIGPDNFGHEMLLIDAECARLAGRRPVALETAQRAAQAARDANHPLVAALALERVAQLLFDASRKLEGTERIRQALLLYEQWGGQAKVAQLQARHGDHLAFVAKQRPRSG